MSQTTTHRVDTAARLEREKAYHNKAFAEDLRKSVDKYYETIAKSRAHYHHAISENVTGKVLLEYGCGPGSQAFQLAAAGAHITGIDISDVAIDIARKQAAEMGVNPEFKVMNAELLEFPAAHFDRIIGSAIIHHLELHQAYQEIVRCLKPGGKAVFIEPLGHNPFINLYRYLTPKLRTEDEHPLMLADIQLARQYFGQVKVRYYHMLSIAAVIFRNTFLFKPVLNVLDGIDAALFTVLPFLKRYAWMSVIELSDPKR